jgi:hypothetical protein
LRRNNAFAAYKPTPEEAPVMIAKGRDAVELINICIFSQLNFVQDDESV